MTLPYKIGDSVLLSKERSGIVRYVGHVHHAKGLYCGIELLGGSIGSNDGQAHGHRYFTCGRNRGVFVRIGQVRRKFREKDSNSAQRQKRNASLETRLERKSITSRDIPAEIQNLRIEAKRKKKHSYANSNGSTPTQRKAGPRDIGRMPDDGHTGWTPIELSPDEEARLTSDVFLQERSSIKSKSSKLLLQKTGKEFKPGPRDVGRVDESQWTPIEFDQKEKNAGSPGTSWMNERPMSAKSKKKSGGFAMFKPSVDTKEKGVKAGPRDVGRVDESQWQPIEYNEPENSTVSWMKQRPMSAKSKKKSSTFRQFKPTANGAANGHAYAKSTDYKPGPRDVGRVDESQWQPIEYNEEQNSTGASWMNQRPMSSKSKKKSSTFRQFKPNAKSHAYAKSTDYKPGSQWAPIELSKEEETKLNSGGFLSDRPRARLSQKEKKRVSGKPTKVYKPGPRDIGRNDNWQAIELSAEEERKLNSGSFLADRRISAQKSRAKKTTQAFKIQVNDSTVDPQKMRKTRKENKKLMKGQTTAGSAAASGTGVRKKNIRRSKNVQNEVMFDSIQRNNKRRQNDRARYGAGAAGNGTTPKQKQQKETQRQSVKVGLTSQNEMKKAQQSPRPQGDRRSSAKMPGAESPLIRSGVPLRQHSQRTIATIDEDVSQEAGNADNILMPFGLDSSQTPDPFANLTILTKPVAADSRSTTDAYIATTHGNGHANGHGNGVNRQSSHHSQEEETKTDIPHQRLRNDASAADESEADFDLDADFYVHPDRPLMKPAHNSNVPDDDDLLIASTPSASASDINTPVPTYSAVNTPDNETDAKQMETFPEQKHQHDHNHLDLRNVHSDDVLSFQDYNSDREFSDDDDLPNSISPSGHGHVFGWNDLETDSDSDSDHSENTQPQKQTYRPTSWSGHDHELLQEHRVFAKHNENKMTSAIFPNAQPQHQHQQQAVKRLNLANIFPNNPSKDSHKPNERKTPNGRVKNIELLQGKWSIVFQGLQPSVEDAISKFEQPKNIMKRRSSSGLRRKSTMQLQTLMTSFTYSIYKDGSVNVEPKSAFGWNGNAFIIYDGFEQQFEIHSDFTGTEAQQHDILFLNKDGSLNITHYNASHMDTPIVGRGIRC